MAADIESDHMISIGESMDGIRDTDHSYARLPKETRLSKQILEDVLLGRHILPCKDIVQQDHLFPGVDGSGQGEPLLLASAQRKARAARPRRISVGKLADVLLQPARVDKFAVLFRVIAGTA